MQNLLEQISFLRPDFKDLIQIALVAYLIYRLLLLWVGTRAIQMLVGLFVLFGVYALAGLLGLDLIRRLLELGVAYFAIAAIVIFQPELRGALARLGQSRFFRFFSRLEGSEAAIGIAGAAEQLSRSRRGALIAIEREVGLEEYAATGTKVQAHASPELLTAIFTPQSPLHDGAVIIRGDQILAAGCILPLTQFPVPDRRLGTRHRAAIGLSEETDALVVVVSEETGAISVAQRGRLDRDVGNERLRDLLGAKASPRPPLTEATQPAGV